MIVIVFTCKTCGKAEVIPDGDIEDKTITPACDDCYKVFLSKKSELVKSFEGKLKCLYEEYGIPVETFEADKELADLKK